MTTSRLVTVVTVFYNNGYLVEEAVSCIRKQDYPYIELILVDDGSTDDTLVSLKRYECETTRVHSQRNRGLGAALRAGFAMARGEFLAYHESGDISLPGRISMQVELFERRPSVGAVSCYVQSLDIDGREIRISKPTVTANLAEQLLERSLFSHSEMVYRRSAYESVGGYRDFFVFSQDNDLFLRLSEVTMFDVVPEVLVVDRRRAEGVMTDPRKTRLARCFRDFAAYCACERHAGREDPLEKLGHAAVFLKPRSARLADRLARDAWKLLRKGEMEIGYEIAAQALGEKATLRSIAAFTMSRMPKHIARLGTH